MRRHGLHGLHGCVGKPEVRKIVGRWYEGRVRLMTCLFVLEFVG